MNATGLKWVRWRAKLGFPVAVLSLWWAQPTARTILAGAAMALLGVVIRAAAAGHLRKSEALATTGPYARTRNPLYLGSALLAAGFMIASRSWVAAVLVGLYYLSLYPFLMRREEAELRANFGARYDEYARRTPLFWPALRQQSGSGGARFSFAQYAQNREYRVAIGAGVVLAGLWALSIWRN